MTHRESTLRRTAAGATRALGATMLAAGLLAVQAVDRSASAQAVCGTRPEIARKLADDYKEAPVALGLSRTGTMIEVFSSGDGDTWSLVVTRPDGRSCLIDSGQGWENSALEPGGPQV